MRALLERLMENNLLNPGIIDLVFWFPHLSWIELGLASVGVLGWGFVSERIWRAVRGFLLRLAARRIPARLRFLGAALRLLARM